MTELQQTMELPARKHPLRAAGICLIAAVLAASIPLVEHTVVYFLVSLMALCAIVPMWREWGQGRLDYFAPIHTVGVVYFVYFGLGALWTVQDPSGVAYDLYIVPYVPRATFYCLLGYLAMLGGYYVPWRGRLVSHPTQEQMRGPLFLALMGGLGIVGYLALAATDRALIAGRPVHALTGSLSQLSPLFLFGWALGWLLWFSRTATRSQRWVLYFMLIPGAVAVFYATLSDKSLAVTLAIIPFIARWYTRRKMPWMFMLVMLLILVFVLFPFYNTFRYSDKYLDQSARVEQTYKRVLSWDSDTYLKFSIGTFKSRLAMINSVAVVVRDVGRWVPYARGETLFMPVLVFLVPRIVWPEKPTMTLCQEFGQLFRVTNSLTAKTHISATVPGELYWNFDVPGILVGMWLFGMVMRIAYRRFGEFEALDPVRRAMLIMLLVQFVHTGGALAPAIVQISRTLVLILLARWACRNLGLLHVEPTDSGATQAA